MRKTLALALAALLLVSVRRPRARGNGLAGDRFDTGLSVDESLGCRLSTGPQ